MTPPATSAVPADRRVLIVTGEASGDLHGANLIRAAREVDPGLAFYGVGGAGMRAAGCEILVPSEDLAVMGLVETVGHLPRILRVYRKLKALLRGSAPPDLLILIDFVEFNLRLAREAKRAGVPVLYYVSPQVWAWRRGRVKTIARRVDRLAAIFPFEPELYRGVGLKVDYVGHPLLDEVAAPADPADLRHRLGIAPEAPVIGLFPGSRRNEIRYILASILDAGERILQARPQAVFLVPVAPSLDPEELQAELDRRQLPALISPVGFTETAGACDVAVTVSGTATLQTALAGTPMVIVYKMSPLTYRLGKRLIRVPHIGLANIVAGRKVVPELIQEQATPERIAAEVLTILDHPEHAERMRSGLSEIRSRMGEPGCSGRVARIASSMARERRTTGEVE